jgi:nicotinate-nucleotide--dimethylbenzimidazole phosphoribosyltransferase
MTINSPLTTDWQIAPLDRSNQCDIQTRIDQKTKPLGALGQLEQLALQIALVQQKTRISIDRPLMLVFAGDHGIAEEGVSIAPSSVTQQMVLNFLAGGAAINCFCRTNHLPLKVIDAGIKDEIKPAPSALIVQRRHYYLVKHSPSRKLLPVLICWRLVKWELPIAVRRRQFWQH